MPFQITDEETKYENKYWELGANFIFQLHHINETNQDKPFTILYNVKELRKTIGIVPGTNVRQLTISFQHSILPLIERIGEKRGKMFYIVKSNL